MLTPPSKRVGSKKKNDMIKEETINGIVFVEQTTYYVYKDSDDRILNRHMISTSNKNQFERLKRDEEMKNQNQ